MGLPPSAFLRENHHIFHRIIMILLLSCTPDSINISSSYDSLPPRKHLPTTALSIPASFKKITLDGHFIFENIQYAAEDFGGRYHHLPSAILHPKSVSDISTTIKHIFELGSSSELTVAARGRGHSLHGQAQARRGLIINMRSLPSPKMEVHDGKLPYVDVSGGALWIDILHETLKHGLAPKSWTDYLHLSVGGTLSYAGISGQAFRHGPQISNVYELEVVTGRGDVLACSEKQNADLFHGALGGLGQFGIITRAKISLGPASERVKWIKVLYDDFSMFSMDQEYLISSQRTFDYIEGFVQINRTGLLNNWKSSFSPRDPIGASQFSSEGKILYCLELAKYYNLDETDIDQKIERLLSRLSYIPSTLFLSDVSLLEFLDRVHISEVKLRAQGLWDVPHPWLNLLVPRSKIHDFITSVVGKIVTTSNNGPTLVYPVNKSRWSNKTSLVTPNEDTFYVVGFLFSAVPATDGLEHILAQNQKILDLCSSRFPGIKQYLPQYRNKEEWRAHFGPRWEVFVRRKLDYDPLAILAPGQRIFQKTFSQETGP